MSGKIVLGSKTISKPFAHGGKKIMKIIKGDPFPFTTSGLTHVGSGVDIHNSDQYYYMPHLGKTHPKGTGWFHIDAWGELIRKYKTQPAKGFYYIYSSDPGYPNYLDIHYLTDGTLNEGGKPCILKQLEAKGELGKIKQIHINAGTKTVSSADNYRYHDFVIEMNNGKWYLCNDNNIVEKVSPKELTLLVPWRNLVPFSGPVTSYTAYGDFRKTGYIFNGHGNGRQYDQNFDGSPLRHNYMRHHDHAIAVQNPTFDGIPVLNGGGRVRMRYVAGSTSGYMGTVSATSGDRGLAEGELEFWKDGGNYKFKLNHIKQYVAHNGRAQRYYPAAINRSLSVGAVHNLTSSWTEIAKFNYATRGGYWAIVYIKVSGNVIYIGQKCDWHGANSEIGAFAILGYDVQK